MLTQKYQALMKRKTSLNTSIGVIILLSAVNVPGMSLLAGGIAGYLESETPQIGARVGITAGVVALGLMLIFSTAKEVLDYGTAHFLWGGFITPTIDGLIPFLLLPLLGGAIGAYIRAVTSSN